MSPMVGPTPHEWLVGVLNRVTYNQSEDKITVDGNDWRNMVAAARKAYNITDVDDEVVVNEDVKENKFERAHRPVEGCEDSKRPGYCICGAKLADHESRLVYCTHCHKTHSVLPTDTPCSPGAWIDPDPIA